MEIKTSNEIAEHLDSIDTLNPKNDGYSEAYSSEKWIRGKDILDLLDSEESKEHKKLEDPELPKLCQANVSGMIIMARYLKKIIGDELGKRQK